jgi:hypothetical protein
MKKIEMKERNEIAIEDFWIRKKKDLYDFEFLE